MKTKHLQQAKLIMENALTGARIIRDYMPLRLIKEPEVLTEETDKGKRRYVRLTALVQKADGTNENGRVYPLEVMEEAVEAIQEAIESRMVLGELDHPDDAKIHTENACLLLTKLWMEGNDVYAQFEILEGLPKGQMLKALIDQNVTVSISSRGVGDMEAELMEDGSEINKVMPGFRFVCFDAVNEPSVKGTALSVMESRQRDARRKEQRRSNELKLADAMRQYLSQ